MPQELGGKSKKYVNPGLFIKCKIFNKNNRKDLDYRFSTNNLTQSIIINHQTFSDELSLKDSNLNYNRNILQNNIK